MNICTICSADGVLEAAGAWYCMVHLGDGLLDVAGHIALLMRWDATTTDQFVNDWMLDAVREYDIPSTYDADDD